MTDKNLTINVDDLLHHLLREASPKLDRKIEEALRVAIDQRIGSRLEEITEEEVRGILREQAEPRIIKLLDDGWDRTMPGFRQDPERVTLASITEKILNGEKRGSYGRDEPPRPLVEVIIEKTIDTLIKSKLEGHLRAAADKVAELVRNEASTRFGRFLTQALARGE